MVLRCLEAEEEGGEEVDEAKGGEEEGEEKVAVLRRLLPVGAGAGVAGVGATIVKCPGSAMVKLVATRRSSNTPLEPSAAAPARPRTSCPSTYTDVAPRAWKCTIATWCHLPSFTAGPGGAPPLLQVVPVSPSSWA